MTRTEHLLTILAEECAEVAQRAAKALRFGLVEVQPGQELTNAERLVLEMNDLVAVWQMLAGEVDPLALGWTVAETVAMVAAKRAKVEKFLEYSAKCGTLSGRQGS